jgi:hypothetical protein
LPGYVSTLFFLPFLGIGCGFKAPRVLDTQPVSLIMQMWRIFLVNKNPSRDKIPQWQGRAKQNAEIEIVMDRHL